VSIKDNILIDACIKGKEVKVSSKIIYVVSRQRSLKES